MSYSHWKWKIAGIGLSLTTIGLAQALTPPELLHWHYILQRLCYFPIILAGLWFGARGGLATALAAAVTYLTHTAKLDPFDLIDRWLEAGMFCLVGTLTGVLSDRERRQRQNLRLTALRLEEVYLELQANVEQLKRAARMSALGHLSAGLAHEIRNPLASIEGAAYLAESEADFSKQREFLAIIGKESKRLNAMVTHFLEFARPRSPEMHPTNVAELIDSVVMLVTRTAAKSEVEVQSIGRSALIPILCDGEQLKQVLLNLILNAIQAVGSKGRVEVDARSESGYLNISVADNGPGISPANVESIFDPFFTTKVSGSGLGLPIAYQIVQQHGGELILSANSNAGCTFVVRLPESQPARAKQ